MMRRAEGSARRHGESAIDDEPRARVRSARRAARTALAAALIATPLAIVAALVWRFHVDVPQWDQWRFPALLASFEGGGLTWQELVAQHNEHRILFPRLLVLSLASLSRWNTSFELAANLVLACAVFALLARETVRRAPRDGLRAWVWLLALESLLVFSLTQWENWLWGMEVAIFLNALGVVGGFAALAAAEIDPLRLGIAVAAGILATYSFANGLLVWPIGAAVVALAPRRFRGALALWLAASAAVVFAYLHGYETPAHTVPWSLWQKPVKHLGYALSYLGAPVVYFDRPGSQLAGAIGVAVLGYAVWRLWRAEAARPAVLFYGALAAYAVASAAITAAGRIEISGAWSSLTSRYITFANLLWLALIGLLSFAGTSVGGARRLGQGAERAVATGFLAALAACVAASSLAAAPWFARQHDKLAPARAALLAADASEVPDELLLRLCWSPELVREGIVALKQNHLWIYAEGRR